MLDDPVDLVVAAEQLAGAAHVAGLEHLADRRRRDRADPVGFAVGDEVDVESVLAAKLGQESHVAAAPVAEMMVAPHDDNARP